MAKYRHLGLAIVVLLCFVVERSHQATMQEAISNNPQLSKFKAKLEELVGAGTLTWALVAQQQTVFAPINSAWDKAPSIAADKIVETVKNHFVRDIEKTWSLLEADRSRKRINSTILSAASEKKLFLHEEHDNFFVSGCMLVTRNFTDPVANEISTDSGVLHLIDCVIAGESHKDNFYDHMKKEASKASEFVKLIDHYVTKAGADGTKFLTDLKSFRGTIFVPKASALSKVPSELERLKNDLTVLADVLKSHMVSNNYIFTRYFHEEVTWETMGKPFVSHAADPVKHPGVERLLDGGDVIAELKNDDANVTMSNGVMQFIDAILQFKYTAYTLMRINRKIDLNPNTGDSDVSKEFVSGISSVYSILGLLNGTSDVNHETTVFAPTHTAALRSQQFLALVSAVDASSTQEQRDASQLAQVLNSCIVKKKLTLTDLRAGVNDVTANGTNIVSEVIGEDVFVTVNNVKARIINSQSGMEASNGVVYIVDKILALKGTDVWEKLTTGRFKEQLSEFNKLVRATGLDTELSDPNQKFTVFAPTNEAFEMTKKQFADQNPSFNDFITKTEYAKGLKVFVKRHIVRNKTDINTTSRKMILQTMNPNERIHVTPLGNTAGNIEVTFQTIGGIIREPYPSQAADNGNFYRLGTGAMYSMADPKIGAVGAAPSIASSLVLTFVCLLLSLRNL